MSTPTDNTLETQLSDTVIWLKLRQALVEVGWGALLDHMNRIWPPGTVPRQQEVVALQQRNTALAALLGDALETMARSGMPIGWLVVQLAALGYDIHGRKV